MIGKRKKTKGKRKKRSFYDRFQKRLTTVVIPSSTTALPTKDETLKTTLRIFVILISSKHGLLQL